jgi:E3 ubiquitin-protein ligase SHPRH
MAAMDNLEFGASLHAEPQWSTDSGVSVESSGMNSPQPLLPLPELPNELIMFMLPDDGSQESPRKRRKVVSEEVAPELEHIVVKKSAWEIKYSGTKLDSIKTSFSRVQIKPYVHWTSQSVPEYLELLDTGESIFRLKLSPEEISEDLQIALLVYKDSRKWAKREGHLWTEFAISLVQKEGCDTVVLDFTIKWNTIPTPYHIHQAAKQPQFLSKVMKRYFSNPNVVDSKMWSPQDFYQSVHTPDKNDPISASMDINGVETMLYPFQKRSVQWLLRREGVEWSQGIGVTPTSVLDTSIIPTSFMEVKDDCGQVCFVSHVLGLVTLDVKPFREAEQLKGGILAEEMGLGKTVEIISLITLHRRSEQRISQVYDKFTATSLRPTGSTLIITPPSILQQWISEINKHSPQLQVIHYEGIKSHQNIDPAELLNQLATSDVVITTYAVLAAEIHFTMLNPEKTLRRAPKYPRSKSPLMLLSWWRCLIDEAQMIESGVSNAAVVARMIPRVNAWCVTGTPVRKNVKDLLGLLVFLRYDPYCSIKHIWSTLISSHKHFFRQLFGALALRHNKQDVREELNLPAQKRYVVTIPFTPVEEQYYHQLFGEMCAEVGLDSSGAPILDTWDLDSAADSMRRWLVRLRQTALHPEIGDQNKKALRQRDGPLRTIDQVLDAMMEQADVAIRTDQRNLLVSKLKRGQLLENSPRVKEALAIWDNAVHEASLMVEGCREQLKEEIGRIQLTENTKESEHQFRAGVENDSDSNDEREEQVFSNPRRVYKLTWDNSVDTSSRLGVFRNRLRNALEILHMGVFFRANAWFQIKSNEDMTTPKTPEFEALEKLETDGYDEAKRLRREILKEVSNSCHLICLLESHLKRVWC